VAKREPRGKKAITVPSRLPRGRHGLSRELVAENQRERLIAGIIAAVAQSGYGAATIAAIIKEAGLSRKTFYEHFKNKEECFEAAYEASFAYLREGVDAVEAPGEDWGRKVRGRLERLLEMLAGEPSLAGFVLIAPSGAGDRIVERHHAAMRELVGALTAGAPSGAAKGEPAGTREQALAGGISRLVVRKLGAGEAQQLPALLPALTELVLRPYIGGEEAVRIATA
jgi:AcrR family transcriptional regulator